MKPPSRWHILKAIAATLGTVATLDYTGLINLLPPNWAKWIAITISSSAILYHLLMTFLKNVDTPES